MRAFDPSVHHRCKHDHGNLDCKLWQHDLDEIRAALHDCAKKRARSRAFDRFGFARAANTHGGASYNTQFVARTCSTCETLVLKFVMISQMSAPAQEWRGVCHESSQPVLAKRWHARPPLTVRQVAILTTARRETAFLCRLQRAVARARLAPSMNLLDMPKWSSHIMRKCQKQMSLMVLPIAEGQSYRARPSDCRRSDIHLESFSYPKLHG